VKNGTDTWWTGGNAVVIASKSFYTICQAGSSVEASCNENTGAGGISPKKAVSFELKDPNQVKLDYFERNNGGAIDANITPDYASTGKSYARCPDGGLFGLATPSANATNPFVADGPIVTNGGTLPHYESLVINEVDGNGKFIEIYNNGTESISLEGLTLVKNLEVVWWTGGAVSLAAGDYYTICQSGQSTAPVDEATGNGGISPKKSVRFDFARPDNFLVDVFSRVKADNVLDANVTDATPNAFARCPNGTGVFGLATPSPDAANPAAAIGPIVTE
jgi:hypothetical protein